MKFVIAAFVAAVSADVGDESDLYGLPICKENGDCKSQVEYVQSIFEDISEVDEDVKDFNSLRCAYVDAEGEQILEEDVCVPDGLCGQKANLEFDGAREILGFTCQESDSAKYLVASAIALLATACAL